MSATSPRGGGLVQRHYRNHPPRPCGSSGYAKSKFSATAGGHYHHDTSNSSETETTARSSRTSYLNQDYTSSTATATTNTSAAQVSVNATSSNQNNYSHHLTQHDNQYTQSPQQEYRQQQQHHHSPSLPSSHDWRQNQQQRAKEQNYVYSYNQGRPPINDMALEQHLKPAVSWASTDRNHESGSINRPNQQPTSMDKGRSFGNSYFVEPPESFETEERPFESNTDSGNISNNIPHLDSRAYSEPGGLDYHYRQKRYDFAKYLAAAAENKDQNKDEYRQQILKSSPKSSARSSLKKSTLSERIERLRRKHDAIQTAMSTSVSTSAVTDHQYIDNSEQEGHHIARNQRSRSLPRERTRTTALSAIERPPGPLATRVSAAIARGRPSRSPVPAKVPQSALYTMDQKDYQPTWPKRKESFSRSLSPGNRLRHQSYNCPDDEYDDAVVDSDVGYRNTKDNTFDPGIEAPGPSGVRALQEKLWSKGETLNNWQQRNSSDHCSLRNREPEQQKQESIGDNHEQTVNSYHNPPQQLRTSRSMSPRRMMFNDSEVVQTAKSMEAGEGGGQFKPKFYEAAQRRWTSSEDKESNWGDWQNADHNQEGEEIAVSATIAQQHLNNNRNIPKVSLLQGDEEVGRRSQYNSTSVRCSPNANFTLRSGEVTQGTPKTQENGEMATLLAKLNAVRRDNPGEALAAIDAILRKTESACSEGNQYNGVNLTTLLRDQSESARQQEHSQSKTPITEGTRQVDNEDEEDDDDDTTVSSMTNPTFQTGGMGQNIPSSFARPNSLQAQAYARKSRFVRGKAASRKLEREGGNSREMKMNLHPPATIKVASEREAKVGNSAVEDTAQYSSINTEEAVHLKVGNTSSIQNSDQQNSGSNSLGEQKVGITTVKELAQKMRCFDELKSGDGIVSEMQRGANDSVSEVNDIKKAKPGEESSSSNIASPKTATLNLLRRSHPWDSSNSIDIDVEETTMDNGTGVEAKYPPSSQEKYALHKKKEENGADVQKNIENTVQTEDEEHSDNFQIDVSEHIEGIGREIAQTRSVDRLEETEYTSSAKPWGLQGFIKRRSTFGREKTTDLPTTRRTSSNAGRESFSSTGSSRRARRHFGKSRSKSLDDRNDRFKRQVYL